MINGGLKRNWYSFYLCICQGYSSDKALKVMGILGNTKIGVKERKLIPEKISIDLERAYELYNTGLTIKEVADQMGVKDATLVVRFRKYGFKTRGRGGFKSKKLKEMYV